MPDEIQPTAEELALVAVKEAKRQAKRAEIKAIILAKNIKDVWVLEHYLIFGTTDLNSVVPEAGAPRNQHYKIEKLRELIDNVFPPVEPAPTPVSDFIDI